MASQNLLELAKQGNIQAIDMLLGRMLEPRGITAKAVLQDGRLHLLLESDQALDQSTLVPFVHQAISRLGSSEIKSLTVYGKQRGQQGQPWSQVVNLTAGEQQSVAGTAAEPGKTTDLPPVDLPPVASGHTSGVTADVATSLAPPAPPKQTRPLSDQYLPQVPPPPPSLIQHTPPPSPLSSPRNTEDSEAILPLDAAWDSQLDDLPDSATQDTSFLSPGAEQMPESIASDTMPDHDDDLIPDVESSTGEMPIARAGAVIALALVLVGIVLVQGRILSGQAQIAVDQADALLAKGATLRKAGDINQLKAMQAEIAQMLKTLQAIPVIPVLVPEGAASEKRAQLAQEQARLQQQIKQEEAASKTLQSAQQAAQAAVNATKDAPNSLPALRRAESKWQEAIDVLETIPKDTIAGKDAAQKLALYQSNLAEIRKQIGSFPRTRSRR